MGSFRLAEVLAGLSLASDLGMGEPADHAMRACLVAVRLAEKTGLTATELSDVYYAALLHHVGCAGDAFEMAAAFGDDIAAHRAGLRTDFSRPADLLASFIPEVGRGRSLGERARLLAVMARHGQRIGEDAQRADCEVAATTARRLGLPASTQAALLQMFEWWNGKGTPHRLRGEDITPSMRIVQVASVAVVFAAIGGPALARDVVRRRGGRTLDPLAAEAFASDAERLLQADADRDVLAGVLELEPDPKRVCGDSDLDDVAAAFGDLADLKAPFFHGHARRVAELAEAGAWEAGLGSDAVLLRRAGFLHDIGRIAVSSGTWAKPRPLGALEWEQVRLHAYHGERILSRASMLRPVAEVAALHHERQDGSGYHCALRGGAVSRQARLLAAADVFAALLQDRPHRARLDEDAATVVLRDEAKAARLDPDCVDAVLAAAGRRRPRRRPWPAELTGRQVEVLRLVAHGLSNRRIAERLTISPRTAEHHVQDVYSKIGVSSRAAAAIYALEHGLLTGSAEDG